MTEVSGSKSMGEGDLTFTYIDYHGQKWEVTGRVEAEIKYRAEYPQYEYGTNIPVCVKFFPEWQEFKFDGLFVQSEGKYLTFRRIDD